MADGSQIGLADGTYRVRVWMDSEQRLVRGVVLNEGTGRSVRFQSGDRVAEFIKECLSGNSDLST